MKKIIGAAVCGLLLAGCATQRPPLQEGQYFGFAKAWHTIGWCAYKGWMDPSTAALGKTYVATALNRYSVDQNRMEQEDKSPALIGALNAMTEGDCRNAAVSVATRKQQIENQNATAEIQQREAQNMINATKPTNTYCNKIGTQVLCNSF